MLLLFSADRALLPLSPTCLPPCSTPSSPPSLPTPQNHPHFALSFYYQVASTITEHITHSWQRIRSQRTRIPPPERLHRHNLHCIKRGASGHHGHSSGNEQQQDVRGFNRRYKHDSSSVGCAMTFSVYFPPAADSGKVPVLYWLSGLTCNDENFVQKAGAQRAAAAHGLALVIMDTSPRGLGVEGESESWDFGTGAGFYLNATQEKWKNWRMYDYVTKELPSLLSSHFPQLDTSNASVFGHSMGGHGALTLFLRNPSKYKSVSAFAPICNPTECPWGTKAFKGYLGETKATWEDYDATLLVKKYNGPKTTILIDQGEGDKFYIEKQLLPENFEQACKSARMPVEVRLQPGYDHSYFFIATFVEDHIRHHSKALGV